MQDKYKENLITLIDNNPLKVRLYPKVLGSYELTNNKKHDIRNALIKHLHDINFSLSDNLEIILAQVYIISTDEYYGMEDAIKLYEGCGVVAYYFAVHANYRSVDGFASLKTKRISND